MTSRAQALGKGFFLWLGAAGVLTFAVHEAAHWLTGTLLGYEMMLSPNQVRATTPMPGVHAALTDAAGPAVTVLTALVAFAGVVSRRSRVAFAFLYSAAFMRLLAAAVSLFNPNDEARLSVYLGLGRWTLPIVVAGGLIGLTWIAAARLKLSWRDHLLCYVIASLVAALVVGADPLWF